MVKPFNLKNKNILRVDVSKLPFPHDIVSKIIEANQNNEELCLVLEESQNQSSDHLFEYLSYSYVRFNIPGTISDDILAGYADKELWFNQNNIVLKHFENKKERLIDFLKLFLNPDLKTLGPKTCDLRDFTLAECSVLEFGDYIFDLVEKENIPFNTTAQKEAIKFSAKRRTIFDYLSSKKGKIINLLPTVNSVDELEYKYRDTLKKNIGSSSLPLGLSKRNTINLHLEILDSCDQSCPGCFVKRKNTFPRSWSEELERFLLLAQYNEWNELVIGPTDIFSATNFDEIFSSDGWSDPYISKFSAITFNTTLNMADEKIIERLQKIKDVFPKRQLEFFVIVDTHRFLSEDSRYMKWLENKLSLLEGSNIILTINTPEVLFWRFESPGEIAYRWFNKNFKYTMSFFRSNNKKIINRYLKVMSEKCEKGVKVLNYVYDRHFGGTTYTTLVYKAGELYWAPCVLDFVFIEDNMFKISALNNTEKLRDEKAKGDCLNCLEQSSCRAKGVLAVKNYLGSTDCILPDDFKQLA